MDFFVISLRSHSKCDIGPSVLFNLKIVKVMIIQDTTMLATLTVADLRDIIRELQSEKKVEVQQPSGRLVYGLRGIQELFGCSHRTAQYYKDNIIKEAVMQNGRKIVVDADLALKLFNERRIQ